MGDLHVQPISHRRDHRSCCGLLFASIAQVGLKESRWQPLGGAIVAQSLDVAFASLTIRIRGRGRMRIP